MDSDFIEDDDFEFTRKKLRELVTQGSDAFEDMIQVAKESEHPRAYEVLSGMMKNIGDVSEKLIDIAKKKKDMDNIGKGKSPEQLPPGSTVTNNVFMGSTDELQKFLLNQQNQVIDVDMDSDS